MKGNMLTIPPAGPLHGIQLTEAPTLKHLQDAVGGYIEAVHGFCAPGAGGPAVAYCNEHGKLDDLPFNRIATDLWRHCLRRDPGDTLCGNVVVLWGDEEFMDAL
jgi:hypothetical protein